jgi:hypothetical protein
VTREPELPALTEQQIEVLRRFASFDIGVEELRRSLTGLFDFQLEANQRNAEGLFQRRTSTARFRLPEPGIVITRQHIADALERKRFDLITERDLVEWATILLLNDAYVLDPADEDLIADWLNDISLHLDID